LSPFLYIGITLTVLNNVGKEFDLILQLNICTRIGATIATLIFAETLSIPVAFPDVSVDFLQTELINLCPSFLELISASVVKSGLFVEFEEMYLYIYYIMQTCVLNISAVLEELVIRLPSALFK